MMEALVWLGVPASRIVQETVSTTTRDEAVVIRPMLTRLGAEQVILITSDVHMRRALGAFRAAGIDALPAIAREIERDVPWTTWLLPTDDGLWIGSLNAHEVIGVTYYWLRGWWK